MTLRFFNNQGKPDTRQTEYEKAIVELGLKKAALEREVDRSKSEIGELSNKRLEVLEEIQSSKNEVFTLENQIAAIKKQVTDAVYNAGQDTMKLKDQERVAMKELSGKQAVLEGLEKYLSTIGGYITEKEDRLVALKGEIKKLSEELSVVRSELLKVKRELEEAKEDLKEIVILKVQVNKELNDIVIQKTEVEEQVSILKADNKGGLDVLASLESERARLKGREEAMDRKEADLKVYENRLAKRAQDLGVDLNMTFK